MKKKVEKSPVNRIDTDSFHILKTMRKRGVGEIMLLIPKRETKPKYYGIRVNTESSWYSSEKAMLDSAVQKGYIGAVGKTLLLGRYKLLSQRYGLQ